MGLYAASGAVSDAAAIERELRNAMGEPWDEELENFRLAGAEAPVIWLRSVSN